MKFIEIVCIKIVCTLWCLASSADHIFVEIHPDCWVYQCFLTLYFWVISIVLIHYGMFIHSKYPAILNKAAINISVQAFCRHIFLFLLRKCHLLKRLYLPPLICISIFIQKHMIIYTPLLLDCLLSPIDEFVWPYTNTTLITLAWNYFKYITFF